MNEQSIEVRTAAERLARAEERKREEDVSRGIASTECVEEYLQAKFDFERAVALHRASRNAIDHRVDELLDQAGIASEARGGPPTRTRTARPRRTT